MHAYKGLFSATKLAEVSATRAESLSQRSDTSCTINRLKYTVAPEDLYPNLTSTANARLQSPTDVGTRPMMEVRVCMDPEAFYLQPAQAGAEMALLASMELAYRTKAHAWPDFDLSRVQALLDFKGLWSWGSVQWPQRRVADLTRFLPWVLGLEAL